MIVNLLHESLEHMQNVMLRLTLRRYEVHVCFIYFIMP